VNLFLDPIPDEELAKIEDDENDYEAIQLEKQRRLEAKKNALLEKSEKYQKAKVDINAPVLGLFTPEEMLFKFGVDVNGQQAAKAAAAAQETDGE
jgi:hypoxanthine-guanine phosphoribosyltransferase